MSPTHSPEDGNRSRFGNVVVFRMLDDAESIKAQ
jgi:hypothetical protein